VILLEHQVGKQWIQGSEDSRTKQWLAYCELWSGRYT